MFTYRFGLFALLGDLSRRALFEYPRELSGARRGLLRNSGKTRGYEDVPSGYLSRNP